LLGPCTKFSPASKGMMPMSRDEAHGLVAEAICACAVGRFSPASSRIAR
jgi:hypothetical protein